MNIQALRGAIYNAETAIETALDTLSKEAGLHANSITVQNVFNIDKNVAPAIKVNITVSRLTDHNF